MIETKPAKFQPGQRVYVLSPYEPIIAKILGVVGPFGGNGMTLYQIRYGSKPSRNIAEVAEDQLVAAPPKATKKSPAETAPASSSALPVP